MYVSMKDMLLHAHHNNYAVMAINCVNMEQVKAVIEGAWIWIYNGAID